jgi:hypothetical protein
MGEYQQRLHNSSLPDLEQYLKFIDWGELKDKKLAQIESLLDELGMEDQLSKVHSAKSGLSRKTQFSLIPCT